MSTRPDPSLLPCSPSDETSGLKYFPRLTGKIRLHAKGSLWEDLHDNLGKGMDGWCCGFLRVNYEALKARTLQGGSDEELLKWCEEHGRPLNDMDREVWNAYIDKLGWKDRVSPILERRKRELGVANRDDIQTMGHYIDVDEGRRE